MTRFRRGLIAATWIAAIASNVSAIGQESKNIFEYNLHFGLVPSGGFVQRFRLVITDSNEVSVSVRVTLAGEKKSDWLELAHKSIKPEETEQMMKLLGLESLYDFDSVATSTAMDLSRLEHGGDRMTGSFDTSGEQVSFSWKGHKKEIAWAELRGAANRFPDARIAVSFFDSVHASEPLGIFNLGARQEMVDAANRSDVPGVNARWIRGENHATHVIDNRGHRLFSLTRSGR
jgi:hypothetical protein